MKTLILLTLFVFNDKYTDQMTKNIQVVYTASTIEDLQKAVNTFERIGGAEKTKWEPYYYASFGYIMMAVKETDVTKKDSFLDLAKSTLDKAAAIKSDESEIVALEGFIHMIRVSVDPASRGQQYSTLAMQAYGKALGLNSQNPRALALMARMQFGTAQFFKQQPTEACQTARKALTLFEAQSGEITVAPSWGKGMAAELVKGCN
jgi:hypothetical protein